MCLVTRQKKPIILEEDLVVYKQGRLEKTCSGKLVFVSGIQGYGYAFDRLYETGIRQTARRKSCVAVFDEIVASNLLNTDNVYAFSQLFDKFNLLRPEFISISHGFHWALSKERYDNRQPMYGRMNIVACVVPAGSQVYFDDSGLGVSNQIIIPHENS